MKIIIAAIVLIATSLFSSAPSHADVQSSGDTWTDHIDFAGDLRLRFEGIYDEFKSDRERYRYRARFGFKTAVSDTVSVEMRLASGGDNPVSNNQTFGNGFSTDDIGLNLAYIEWKLADGMNLYAGKMKNPAFRAGGVPLIWDSDLTPEGFALKVSSGMFFGTLGAFIVEERKDSDNSQLYVVQGGVKFPLGANNQLIVGAGYFAYTNTIGNSLFYRDRAKGNTVDIDGNYVFEYKDTELFAQFDTKVMNWPLKLFAHYARNSEVSRQDVAIAYGARLGSYDDKGEMQFAWAFQDIEADAVISTFNDSDFGGGGTDANGHIFLVKYAYSNKLILGGTFFLNKVERFQGIEHDYSRIQIDLVIKFD